jgi:membrane protease YdiL (CAAX protease family)
VSSWLAYALAVYLFAYLSAIWPGVRPPLEIPALSTLQSADHRFLLIYMMVNPWFEEILVRGFIATELETISGRKWVGIWGSTIFQGAYHLYQGWTLAVSQSVGFLIFAIYFAKTRRLYPVIIAHALADLLAYMYMAR